MDGRVIWISRGNRLAFELPYMEEYKEFEGEKVYIIINRAKLPKLSYSANEIYRFIADGKKHYIEKYYEYDNTDYVNIDAAIVEGSGSDFVFFSHLFKNNIQVWNPMSFGNLQSAGRSNMDKKGRSKQRQEF